jgi:hypothetical protein
VLSESLIGFNIEPVRAGVPNDLIDADRSWSTMITKLDE